MKRANNPFYQQMRILIFSFIILCMAACNSKQEVSLVGEGDHFSIKDSLQYTIIDVHNPFVGSTLTERYVLYPRDEEKPEQVEATHYIAIPVNKVAINSTTHLGFLKNIGVANSITAVSNPYLYYDETFFQRIVDGEVKPIGEQKINEEQLIEQDVDLLFTFIIDAASLKEMEKFRELDQNIILISEYMESDPLKRAEWIKLFACFYGKEVRAKAEKLYNEIAANYQRIKEQAELAPDVPTVIIGLPWKGNWFVSGGKSFQAALIKDANGFYVWNKFDQLASVPVDIESAINMGLGAEVWINPGIAQSKDEILENDERFMFFSSLKDKRIYSNYRKSNDYGANDYWEQGVVRPDLILADLYAIFHPKGKALSDSLNYYKRIE